MSEPIDARASAGVYPPGQAPRVSEDRLKSIIREVSFVLMPDGRTTVCHLSLENGFSVRGESSCVFIENFDADVGRDIAYKQAFAKLWQLEGYLLAQRHYEERQRFAGEG